MSGFAKTALITATPHMPEFESSAMFLSQIPPIAITGMSTELQIFCRVSILTFFASALEFVSKIAPTPR